MVLTYYAAISVHTFVPSAIDSHFLRADEAVAVLEFMSLTFAVSLNPPLGADRLEEAVTAALANITNSVVTAIVEIP